VIPLPSSDPAFALLIDCCRHRFGALGASDLCQRLQGASGERLTALARRHGLERLVWQSLRECALMLPGTAPLAMAAERRKGDGWRLALEAGRIHRMLVAASLPHLFPEGPALGQQAWGEPLSMNSELELFVAPAAIAKCAALLARLGYVQEEPDPSVDPLDWHRRSARSRWRSDDGLLLDLRTRLQDEPGVLEQLTATTLPVLVDVGSGILVPALTAELQLSLLAVRGASEAWHRLDRLAALAALASKLSAPALEAAVERSVRLETERPLAAGLVLAHRLFGTRLPSELWVDGGAARLVRIGLAELGAPKPTLYRSSLSRALLKPGSRFFLGSLFRQLGRALLL
jgi:hypothetical protein